MTRPSNSHPGCSLLTLLALLVLPLQAADTPAFADPFAADTKVPERRAMRGDWRIADGIARCTQDDALYKKYKDHGPIIFYDVATTDSTVRYSFKPQGCKSVVFTLNGEKGHVFRFVTGARGTSFRAFPPDSGVKSIETGLEKDWLLKEGEWTSVEVKIAGNTATVKFGDHQEVAVKHGTYAAEKANLSVGFSFGTLAVKGVEVTK